MKRCYLNQAARENKGKKVGCDRAKLVGKDNRKG